MPEVILVRAGALGDLLLLRPAIHACRQRGFRVALLAPLPAAAVLLGSGAAEAQSIIDWESAPVSRLLVGPGRTPLGAEGEGGRPREPVSRRLRQCAGIVAFSRQQTLIKRLAQLNLNCAARDPTPPTGLHAAAWYLQALLESSFPGPPPAPSGQAAPSLDECPPLDHVANAGGEARRVLRDLPDRFLALHAGSGSPRKNWPAASFAKLVSCLSEGRPWLLVEGPADGSSAATLARLPNCVKASLLPLRALAAVLARSGAFVGNDSGVTHLAAASGAPTLALFGPTDPAVWRPLGRRVRVLRSSSGRMEDLDPALVVAALRQG